MSRRKAIERRNVGGTFGETIEPFFEAPTLAQARTSGVMVERVLYAVLKTELERLSAPANVDDLRRVFRHVFDPLAGDAEREEYVTHLRSRPPTVVLGYPRTTAQPPIVAITLGEEEEEDSSASLGDFIGESLPGEAGEATEYLGVHFRQTFHVYCFSDHPVVAAYLYHVVKLILLGAKKFLIQAGVVDPRLSGGELAPDEDFTPEDWFSRVVRVTCFSLNSVPVLTLDPARYRITGVHMHDVSVDGVQGGVTPVGSEGSEA